MARDEGSTNEGLTKQYDNDATAVRGIYDEWSQTYDSDIEAWGYEAPSVAAALLASQLPVGAQVLDAGCGTGKVGMELQRLGFHDVVGVDISEQSLDLAGATGAYRALGVEDFTALPTSLANDTFSGLICVGVMTYLAEVEAVCREFCRVVEPDGVVVLTQRTDLFAARDTQAAFDRLVDDETWRIIELTTGRPYLPQHQEYEQIQVRYGVFQRL